MSKTTKLLAVILTAVMTLAMLPVASLAMAIDASAMEATRLGYLDAVWEDLDAVESEMLALGATPSEVTMAVYKAALKLDLVDEGSIADLDDNGFSFKVNGMASGYDYKIRNTAFQSSLTSEAVDQIIEVVGTKNSPSSTNVLLVGPWYASDTSFTDQYKTEAQSIATATGGTYTLIKDSSATGTAVAAAYTGKGVVIYDSHGAAYNSTSYLCLTASTGLTSSDYSNGWAYNGGSWYGIDGRYIKNYVSGTLSNCIVWMAICEGMKSSGGGVTGTALLSAGAACVYGYSQSVSFTGDYKYETYFWNMMKNGSTVSEAYTSMTASLGNWDPAYSSSSGAAWPIVMSPTDSFPSNPDSHQTVTCDWTLMGSTTTDPVAITSASIAAVTVNVGATAQSVLTVAPTNVDYTVTYASSNTSVATVNSSGVVTGVAGGTATLTATIHDNVANTNLTRTAAITVTSFVGWVKADSITAGGTYIIVAEGSGNAVSNNAVTSGHYLAPVDVTVNSDDTLTVDSSVNIAEISWVVAGSSSGWTFCSVDDNMYMGLDSSEYLAPTSTSHEWVITTEGYLDNQTDSESYYYLSYSSSGTERYTTAKSSSTSTPPVINFYQYVTGSTTTTYTVTFVDYDGTVLSTQTVDEGGSATAPANPTRTGYTFAGWSGSYTNVTGNVTVTATYTINSYTLTITYKYSNGTTAATTHTSTVNYGSTYSVTSPTITGYTASQATVSGTMGTAAVTVNVVYTVRSYTLTITYVYSDGTTAATTYTGSVNYGSTYSVTSPTIEGYTPSQAVVSGTMGTTNVDVTVTYTADATPTVTGDINCDGTIDFSDVSALYGYILNGNSLEAEGLANADVNGDGIINFADASALAISLLS